MSESDADMTTDALPSPPRRPSSLSNKDNIYAQNDNHRKPKKQIQKKEQIEEKEPDDDDSEPKANSYEKPPDKPVVNVIQIINSPNTHVGNTIYHNYTSRKCKREESPRESPKESKEIIALKNNSKPVLEKDLNVVKDYIGYKNSWEDTFIELGFTRSQIQQHQYRFERDFNGLIAFLLLDWKQVNGNAATVSTLANVLWDTNQHEALIYWSTKYDALHKNRK